MAENMTLTSRGLRLAGRVWGDASGAPILALHGWLDNANTFETLAPLLPGYRVIGLDMPGHGHSDHHGADAEYHFVDWVGYVLDAVEELGWSRFTLMGHSMGAAISCLFAGAYPQRVERLVLLDGLGPLSGDADDVPARLVMHLKEQNRLRNRAQPSYRNRAEMAAMLSRVVPKLSLAGATRLLGRGAKELPDGRFTWSSDPRLRGTSVHRLTEAQVLAFLRRIACPTLLVRAIDGFPFDAAQMAQRVAAIAGLHRAELSGGHHVHLEDPARVAELVLSFLRRGGAQPDRP